MARTPFFALSLAVVIATFASACAAPSASESDDSASNADELTAGLRDLTVVRGSVPTGSSVTVKYEPAAYDLGGRLPFLAVEILPPAAAGGGLRTANHQDALAPTTTVSVSGDFPGSPRVLVVDEAFHVLAAANGVRDELTGENRAELSIAASSGGKRFVLVRDGRWIKPMSFDIGVGR